jgi:hypothetical protein
VNDLQGPKSIYVGIKSISPFLELIQGILHKFKCFGAYSKIQEKRLFINVTEQELSEYDHIFVHDLTLLPYFINHMHKVIFDAREYYPLQTIGFEKFDKYTAHFYEYLCKQYIHRASHRITVSNSIAELYKEHFDVHFDTFPSFPLKESVTDVADTNQDSVVSRKIRLIHHGGAAPNRNLEKLIELSEHLEDRFHVYLMLVNSDIKYFNKLVKSAKGKKNVTIIPPVDFEKIIGFISGFDIGLHLLEGQDNQHPYCLPNKFFEFVNAGLMLIVSGSKEMYQYAENDNLGLRYNGVVDLDTLAKDINSLSDEDIKAYKLNSRSSSKKMVFEAHIGNLENKLM